MSESPLATLRATASVTSGGLTIVLIPLPSAHRVVLEADCRIGSRYEAPADNGLSHFLEHMLYRGTPRYPSAYALALAVEERGGELAAATSVDHGALTLTAPPETFAELLPVFAEVYASPRLEGLEAEKGIVREEILEGLDDSGQQIDAENLVRALSFGDHPLGRPITGTVSHVDGFDRPRLLAHHRAHYTSDGTVLTVAGPIDPARLGPELEAAFRELPRGRRPLASPPETPDEPRFLAVQHASSSQTSLRLVFRAPAETDPDEPATELLTRLLDDGLSTRLYHRICDELGLCYDVFARYEAYQDSGLLELGADTAHENAAAVIEELFAIAEDLRSAGPTARELDKAKARYHWQLTELVDDPAALAEHFGLEHLIGTACSPHQRWQTIEGLSAERVRAAAARVFDRRHAALVGSGRVKRATQERLLERLRRF